MRRLWTVIALVLLVIPNTACEPGLAWGDPQAVVVVAPEALWPTVEDSVYTVLSPSIMSVREDYTFRVNYRSPTDTNNWWRFRELVLIGSQDEPWLAEALVELPQEVSLQAPGIYEVKNVWATGQTVTILLTDPQGDVQEQVFSHIDGVHEALLGRFLAGAWGRMFMSGIDSALVDTLQYTAGFSLLLPEVYDWGVEDSVYVFRNDNPDPAELIRQFTVTWRASAPMELPADTLLAWREAISRAHWTYPQVVDEAALRTAPLPSANLRGSEIRGAWKNPPESLWPAAGAFILWNVACPHQNRTYLVDAWLYAPGEDKWEYMLQLETIMNSFRCGTQGI